MTTPSHTWVNVDPVLCHCWELHNSMTPHCVTRPQWVKASFLNFSVIDIITTVLAGSLESPSNLTDVTAAQLHWYQSYMKVIFNSLWPTDTQWRHRTGSTLAQVMAWCLLAPSHYLNKCWLISKIQWHSFDHDGNFNSSPPRQNDRDFADNILKCILLDEQFVFRFNFHRSLFLRVQVTISQHWFR